MSIHERTPIREQSGWRIVGGMAVGSLLAILFFLFPLYVVPAARDESFVFRIALFWTGGGVFLHVVWQGVTELLRRQRARSIPQ